MWTGKDVVSIAYFVPLSVESVCLVSQVADTRLGSSLALYNQREDTREQLYVSYGSIKKPQAWILLYLLAFIEIEGNKEHLPGAFETEVELSLSTP